MMKDFLYVMNSNNPIGNICTYTPVNRDAAINRCKLFFRVTLPCSEGKQLLASSKFVALVKCRTEAKDIWVALLYDFTRYLLQVENFKIFWIP